MVNPVNANNAADKILEKLWGDPSFRKMISMALTQFADQCVAQQTAELLDENQAHMVGLRNMLLDKVCEIAKYHSGPSEQLVEKIRALK